MNRAINYGALFRLVTVIGGIVIGVLLFSKLFIGGTLVVDASEADSISTMNVLINGKVVPGRNEAKKSFQLNRQVGTKKIIVRRAGYKDFETSKIVFFRIKTTVKPIFAEQPADDLAKKIDAGRSQPGTAVSGAKYFMNHEWLAYHAKNGGGTDSIVVRYDSSKADWIIQNDGQESELFVDEKHPLPTDLYNEFLGSGS